MTPLHGGRRRARVARGHRTVSPMVEGHIDRTGEAPSNFGQCRPPRGAPGVAAGYRSAWRNPQILAWAVALRRGIVAIGQHCCRKASFTDVLWVFGGL